MAKGKGYVYIMTTAVNGIIKIGQSKDWTARCKEQLEENGYKNMNGLKTFFVVEVPDMDEYEGTMHDIFRESRVISRKENGKDTATELFAVDKYRAKRVLEKMGKQVCPEITDKNTKSQNNQEEKENNTYTLKDIGIKTGDILIAKDFGIKVSVENVDRKAGDKVKYLGEERIKFNYKTPNGKDVFLDIKKNDITTSNQILVGYCGMNGMNYNWNSREKFYPENSDKSIYEIAKEMGFVK